MVRRVNKSLFIVNMRIDLYDKYRELVRKKEDLNLVGMLTKRRICTIF